MMDENGTALALKIVELYEERDSLKSMIDSSHKDFADISKRCCKSEGLLAAYRAFYKDIRKAVTRDDSYDSTIKAIEGAVRSMQGIDEEFEKMLDEAEIKRIGGQSLC